MREKVTMSGPQLIVVFTSICIMSVAVFNMIMYIDYPLAVLWYIATEVYAIIGIVTVFSDPRHTKRIIQAFCLLFFIYTLILNATTF